MLWRLSGDRKGVGEGELLNGNAKDNVRRKLGRMDGRMEGRETRRMNG